MQGDVQDLTESLREDITNTHVPNSFSLLFFSNMYIYYVYIYAGGRARADRECSRGRHQLSSPALIFRSLFFEYMYILHIYVYAGGRARANRESSRGYHQLSCHKIIFPSFFFSNMYTCIHAGGRARANREYLWGYHQPSCHELIFLSLFFVNILHMYLCRGTYKSQQRVFARISPTLMSRTHSPFFFFPQICICIYMQGDVQELTESIHEDITNPHVTNSFSLLFFFTYVFVYLCRGTCKS